MLRTISTILNSTYLTSTNTHRTFVSALAEMALYCTSTHCSRNPTFKYFHVVVMVMVMVMVMEVMEMAIVIIMTNGAALIQVPPVAAFAMGSLGYVK